MDNSMTSDGKMRKLEELQREEQERQLRLEAIRAQVAIVAERDPQRLLQPTAASAAEADHSTALFTNHGFTDEHLFRDQRFKVAVAYVVPPSFLKMRQLRLAGQSCFTLTKSPDRHGESNVGRSLNPHI
eukprot:scaffold130627_cov51-Prasinocladus_malaysianus.AAC.1